MAEEKIELSQQERDRLKVLHEVQRGYLTQREAGERLKRSARQVRRMLKRVGAEGDRGLVHRLRGRRSNREIAVEQRERVMKRVRQRYADFGPTLGAEQLAREGLVVSRETLRKWLVAEGLWRPRRQRLAKVHLWRERRAMFGELVMLDSSPYAWLEDRGPELQLVAMIDDATSRFRGRFARHDTTAENMHALREWLERYGRPVALYTDKNSIFQVNRSPDLEEQLAGEAAQTQFGRALGELGIEWIAAHSPQAKGRVERLFGTLQNRLVKELRLAGVNSIEQANRFLEEEFIPFWQGRFTVAPRQSHNAHRPLGREHRLAEILSHRERRLVAQDYTVRWHGEQWAIPRDEVRPGLRQARVEVEQRLDGSLWVRFRGHYLSLHPCPRPAAPATSVGLRPPGVAGPSTTIPTSKPKPKYTPPPDHPWKRTFLSCRKEDISNLR